MVQSSSSLPDKTTPNDKQFAWKKLTLGKELSRLLYPNPVCFLCTCAENSNNVMVLSWLTATNNQGRFLFSIHKRRHTASLLQTEFVLSIPVHGMEPLLCQVGGVSGSWGSKFPAEASNKKAPPNQKKLRFPQGIPGLKALSLAAIDASPLYENTTLFGIEGCVAFAVCQIHQILDDIIDEEHLLVVAEMKVAWVHPDYWSRNRFLPLSDQLPSYLTFLGSQTFGQVVVAADAPNV